ncbi:PGBD5 [Cordylochernes scorpioides]|uniref:PGBD5 n=1 Tax=Cordylochernes scorpioides TaxID=51811 RepID=A0ABY6LED7_9ARAC|nr:PGBD5 [Cordylochernes scorpioides]
MASAAHPQTNGLCEKLNGIRVYLEDDHAEWPRFVKTATFAYNSSIQSSTQVTPHKLIFGVEPRTSLDVGLPTVDEPVKTYDEYVTNRILENERLKKIADENYRDRTMMTKCQYDLANRDRFRKFEVGDLVLLESSRRKPGKTEKFLPKYVGPTSKGLGSEVHLDEDIQDILEYLYDSGSEIDDEVKDPDYENSASDELEFEEEEREEIPAKRPRLEVALVRMLTTCRDTSTAAAAGSNVAAGTWRKDDPLPPTSPPFTARPGLNLVRDVSSPFDAFSLFFTENIFKSIKEETNRYARSIIDRESKKGPLKPHGMLAKWKAVSVAQIKLFFCVIIHMSLVKKPGMKDYWSTHGFLKNAFCQSINMPRTLFMRILSMLHLNDNSKYIECGKPGHDRLFKIRPVLESLIYSFGNAYTPQQNLTIDEAMCPFRGRVGFRVYIKGKPHKYGIKIFQICEAVSGYAYNLDIYTGKDPEQPEHNSNPNLVDRLAKRFYGQGYHIYFDRWFSSPELFDKLWEKKTLAVGTVMPSRKTMPKTEFSQKLKRGEIIKMRRKHLLAIKWKDVRDVFMLSTVHEGKMMPVKPKTPTREELFKPDAVIDYNKGKAHLATLVVKSFFFKIMVKAEQSVKILNLIPKRYILNFFTASTTAKTSSS